MRFQFKLLIALVGSIAAATLFSLWETGKTVRATHRAMFESRFQSQMDALMDVRQERLQRLQRLQRLTELCEQAAEAELVVDALRRPNDRVVMERLREDHMTAMTAMTEVVYQHGGVVDKYVGDLVMAIFGAPKSYGNDAENALRCALAMVERQQTLNADAEVPIEIGIGVATGEMVVGMMGSEHRQDYTVIGERVNLGSRLTDAAATGEVIIDATSVQSLGEDHLEIEERQLTLKGYTDSVRCYRLNAIAEPAVSVVSS